MDDIKLRSVLDKLKTCKGVVSVKLLDEDEKELLLKVERKAEEKILWGMCRSLNQGFREAISRHYTIAMVINTEEFEYPHHPYTIMKCGGLIVGEQILDSEEIGELRKDPANIFLWDEFVVYVKKLPKDPEERKKLRIVFLPRTPQQLASVSFIEKTVFGVPSVEGDLEIKKLLGVKDDSVEMGSCIIGLEIKHV